MDYYYILAAAGVGKRMKLTYPKQFLEVNSKPIFIKTLEVIEKSREVKSIIIVTQKEFINMVKEMCIKFKISKVINVIEGGKTRQKSVYNAIKLLPKKSIIGIQDGVRPFMTEKYIEETYNKLLNDSNIDGVVVGIPVKDTIKIIDNKKTIKNTPKRDSLFIAQTPQVFRGEILYKSHEKAVKEGFIGSDDSSLVERNGGKVKFILGSYNNIKITTPEDLIYLSAKGD